MRYTQAQYRAQPKTLDCVSAGEGLDERNQAGGESEYHPQEAEVRTRT